MKGLADGRWGGGSIVQFRRRNNTENANGEKIQERALKSITTEFVNLWGDGQGDFIFHPKKDSKRALRG